MFNLRSEKFAGSNNLSRLVAVQKHQYYAKFVGLP